MEIDMDDPTHAHLSLSLYVCVYVYPDIPHTLSLYELKGRVALVQWLQKDLQVLQSSEATAEQKRAAKAEIPWSVGEASRLLQAWMERIRKVLVERSVPLEGWEEPKKKRVKLTLRVEERPMPVRSFVGEEGEPIEEGETIDEEEEEEYREHGLGEEEEEEDDDAEEEDEEDDDAEEEDEEDDDAEEEKEEDDEYIETKKPASHPRPLPIPKKTLHETQDSSSEDELGTQPKKQRRKQRLLDPRSSKKPPPMTVKQRLLERIVGAKR
ncbi:hypothetical protein BDF14DRAFT_856976 [Spinellus fusiger]|nr:hypothetical protein BDF14DRAFT_856976 [Spinellus fusiger]